MSETLVRCKTCAKERRVSFGACLRSGWPTCCGATMGLVGQPSQDTIDCAVAAIMRPVKVTR
jgi:hypothetical protein